MKLQTLSYPNPLFAFLEDFFSIRFKPHHEVTNLLIEKIAQKISDREAAIKIGIADHFSNGDRDRRSFLKIAIFYKNRDRNSDLNFGDRAHIYILLEGIR